MFKMNSLYGVRMHSSRIQRWEERQCDIQANITYILMCLCYSGCWLHSFFICHFRHLTHIVQFQWRFRQKNHKASVNIYIKCLDLMLFIFRQFRQNRQYVLSYIISCHFYFKTLKCICFSFLRKAQCADQMSPEKTHFHLRMENK